MGWGPFKFLKCVIAFAVMALVMGLFGMLLWNALIPDLFHGPVLIYWQAVGLIVLARIFLGHRGGGCGRGRHSRYNKWQQKFGGDPNHWCGSGGKPGKGQWSWTWQGGEEEKHEER